MNKHATDSATEAFNAPAPAQESNAISGQTERIFRETLGVDINGWPQSEIEAITEKVAAFYVDGFSEAKELRRRLADREIIAWRAAANGRSFEDIARDRYGGALRHVVGDINNVTTVIAERNRLYYDGSLFNQLLTEMREDGFTIKYGSLDETPAVTEAIPEPATEATDWARELYLRIFGQDESPIPSDEVCARKLHAALTMYEALYSSRQVPRLQRERVETQVKVARAALLGRSEAHILERVPGIPDIEAVLGALAVRVRALVAIPDDEGLRNGSPAVPAAPASPKPASRTRRPERSNGIKARPPRLKQTDDPDTGAVATSATRNASADEIVRAHRAKRKWQSEGACRSAGIDPEIFFPVGTSYVAMQRIAAAKAVCGRCIVKAECLDFANTTSQAFGIWGGETKDERRSALKRRR